jgi:hypothetical protein
MPVAAEHVPSWFAAELQRHGRVLSGFGNVLFGEFPC